MAFLTDNHHNDKEFDSIRDPRQRDAYGRFQLDFLVANGLRPDSQLLDFGCGDLRLGEKAIP